MRNILQQLEQEKIIAIMRGVDRQKALLAGQALVDGGIRFLEVTLNTENALEYIHDWRTHFPSNVQIGAGTVMNRQMVKEAVAAGATYIITPNLDQEVIKEAQQQQIEIWPGVLTPSEVASAIKMGVRAVKVFPIHYMGSNYIRDLQGPYDQLKAIAVGGVKIENMQDYLQGGAIAVAFGSTLFHPEWIAQEKWNWITQRAKKVKELTKT